MSYTVTKYPQGTFSWADFFSKDVEKSKAFFNGLMGWTSQDMPTGEGRPNYTMFYLDGVVVAGGGPTFDPSMWSVFNNYITVDDVDEMTKKAEGLGAKVMMAPMDVMDVGRMSTIQDPTGAVVCLWQAKTHIGAGIVNVPGAMGWNELYTRDMDASKQFYTDLLNWDFEVDEQSGYVTIKNNGRNNGGMMKITKEMGEMPAKWMTYFTVKNLDESVAKVTELGGKVWMTKDLGPVGRIGMIEDPAGLNFIIIELATKPEEWVE